MARPMTTCGLAVAAGRHCGAVAADTSESNNANETDNAYSE
jgi:hypothetical protein